MSIPEGVPAAPAATLCLMTVLHLKRRGEHVDAGANVLSKHWFLCLASKPGTGLVGTIVLLQVWKV